VRPFPFQRRPVPPYSEAELHSWAFRDALEEHEGRSVYCRFRPPPRPRKWLVYGGPP
jgi:hypothetical protein